MSSPSRELGSEMGFYLMETVVREHGEEVDERKLRAPSMYIFLSRIRIVLIGEAGQFCSKSERTGRRRRERARHDSVTRNRASLFPRVRIFRKRSRQLRRDSLSPTARTLKTNSWKRNALLLPEGEAFEFSDPKGSIFAGIDVKIVPFVITMDGIRFVWKKGRKGKLNRCEISRSRSIYPVVRYTDACFRSCLLPSLAFVIFTGEKGKENGGRLLLIVRL